MKGGIFMRKGFKKFLGVLIAAVMVLSSLPLSVFAADVGSTLTIYTNVTAKDIEIDENVSFEYLVAIGGLLYNGAAEGDDGNIYNIVDGKLTLPYNVKAVISGLRDGENYNVQRLTYDNPKYALVSESGHITGEIASREYYKTVNGDRTQIDAEMFANETDNGKVLDRHFYLSADEVEYYSAETKKFFAYEENSTLGVPNGTYSAVEHEYIYAPGTFYDFSVSITDIHTNDIKTQGSWVKTYVPGNVYATVSTSYSDSIVYNGESSDSIGRTSKALARSAMKDMLQKLEGKGMYEVLSAVAEDSGKTAVVAEGLITNDVSENTTLPSLSTKMYIFTEVTEQNISYEAIDVEANKVAAFDVTLEKAPTGTVSVDFILDGTVPEGFDGAVFEIRNAQGDLLTEGVDYYLEVNDVSIDVKVAEIGFTRYIFSGLLSGSYKLQQIEGAPSYAVDTTKYAFTVERDGSVSGENVAEANGTIKDPSAVIYNTTKNLVITKPKFFANASFTLSFTTLDQNDDPVSGAQYFLVERDEVIKLLSTVAGAGVTSVTNTDWGALLSSLTSDEGFTFDLETLVKLLVEVVSNGNLESVTLPAILMKKSGDDGVTTFDNASNILNALDILSSLGDVKLSDLANLIKTIVGEDKISGDLAKYLDMLAGFDMSISVHAGVPTGAYLFFETSAPKGYNRSSTLFTIDVAADGTAEVYSGVLLPLIADYIDGRLGYDIYNILISEEEFNNAAENVKNMFGTFENYKNTVVNGILDFVDATLGDRLDLGALERISNAISGYYDQYDDLSAAIGSALRDFNKSLVDTFDGEWILRNNRIFVSVIITVADCQNNDITAGTVTVTNVNDPSDKYTGLDKNGNAYLHYGEYAITVEGLDGKYVLFTDTDEEGNALYSNPASLVINDDNNGEQNVSFYFHEDGGWQHMDDATCITDGFEMRACKKCEIVFEEKILPATGHKYSEPETIKPTCTSGGYTVEICDVCGDVKITNEAEALEHNYETTVVEPTHSTQGYTKHTCSRCGDTYIDSYVPAEDHTFVLDASRSYAATCLADGKEIYVCSDDACDAEEEIILPALGHDIVNDPAVSPTCTKPGKTAGSHCSRCDDATVAQNEIPEKGHSLNITTVPPTCTENGTITKKCANCDHEEIIEEPARGHNYKYTYIDPTCTEPGKIVSECLRCTYSETADDPEKPALDHDYKVRTIEATCERDGVTVKTCSRCNDKVEIERVKKLGHKIVADARIEPTCTEIGWSEGAHCERCMKIDGVEGASYQKKIDALGHEAVVDGHVAPTCTEDGLTAGSHCSRCNEALVEQIVIPALGHETGNWKIVSVPTAEEDGLMIKTCLRCGETVEEKSIPFIQFGDECECDECRHGDGNYICICKYSIKVQKVFYKIYKIIYKIFGVLFKLPHMCSHFGRI